MGAENSDFEQKIAKGAKARINAERSGNVPTGRDKLHADQGSFLHQVHEGSEGEKINAECSKNADPPSPRLRARQGAE